MSIALGMGTFICINYRVPKTSGALHDLLVYMHYINNIIVIMIFDL